MTQSSATKNSLFSNFPQFPQISICSCEWAGRLKCLATGLDRSDPFATNSTLENQAVN